MRVMFVHQAQPLVGAAVDIKRDGETLAHEVSDLSGQIDVPADEGTVEVVIQLPSGSAPVRRQITLDPSRSLLVVDISASDERTSIHDILKNPQDGLGERYTFEDILGRGGMGVVMRARDTVLNRVVAIKTLNSELADNEEAQRIFLTEARAIATLDHPNLVGIYDVSMIDGRAMIVFEHVEGIDLETILEEDGFLPEAALVRVAIQMARALAYLHERGVIHRDIKPANALIQADGLVRIIDFGLARSLEEIQIKGTQIRGTPAYMAPEQLTGEDLFASTDIYQLGVMLYELACGQLPFTGGAVAYSHLHEEPPLLVEANPSISEEIAAWIHRCLHKEPGDRPTARDVLNGFKEIYRAHEAAYMEDERILAANEDALFRESATRQRREIRASMSSAPAPDAASPSREEIAHAPTQDFETSDAPAPQAPEATEFERAQDARSQRRVAGGVFLAVLLLGGIGAVFAIGLINSQPKAPTARDGDEREKAAARAAEVIDEASAFSPTSPQTDEQPAQEEEDQPDSTPSSAEAEVAEPPKPAEDEATVSAPTPQTPEPSPIAAAPNNSPDDSAAEKSAKPETDAPGEKPGPKKSKKAGVRAATSKTAASERTEDASPDMANSEQEPSPATAEREPREEESSDGATEAPTETSGEAKSRRNRVIRRRIIRRRVRRSSSSDEKKDEPRDAPNSF